MTDASKFIVHLDPVWRGRSNFIIRAPLREEDQPWRFEQLYARQVGEDLFEVCCIPFFVYDLALGDVVATSPRPDGRYVIDRVVSPSGRHVFRAWFGESFHHSDDPADHPVEIVKGLRALGALTEWSSRSLLAVDAADEEHARQVADFLVKQQQAGQLIYERGSLAADSDRKLRH